MKEEIVPPNVADNQSHMFHRSSRMLAQHSSLDSAYKILSSIYSKCFKIINLFFVSKTNSLKKSSISMFDYENDAYFCICGQKIHEQGTCGKNECIENFESFREEIENFFNLIENQSLWKGFEKFLTLDTKLQIGIFFELEDELMLLFLQGLGQDKVLELLQYKSDAFRYRFLELIEPLLEESLVEEFKQIQDLTKDELKEFLLQIIDIMLQSVEKKE